MNFTFNEETGKGYIEVQPGTSADKLSDLLVDLHFDDVGVLVGIEILPKPDGDYYEGRNEAANDILNVDITKLLPPNVNILDALELLRNKLADIARGK
jgi:hypothetical protein